MKEILLEVHAVQKKRKAAQDPGATPSCVVIAGAGAGPFEAGSRAAKQQRVSMLKQEALEQALPGRVAKYVGPKGETWQLAKDARARASAAGFTKKVVLGSIKAFLGPGCDDIDGNALDFGEGTIANVVTSLTKADFILVDSVAGRWEDSTALHARLFGARLADLDWLKPKRKFGQLVAFRNQLSRGILVAVSDEWASQFPDHIRVLRKASRGAEKQGLHFRATEHANPDVVPRSARAGAITLMCCSAEEAEAVRAAQPGKKIRWIRWATDLCSF